MSPLDDPKNQTGHQGRKPQAFDRLRPVKQVGVIVR